MGRMSICTLEEQRFYACSPFCIDVILKPDDYWWRLMAVPEKSYSRSMYHTGDKLNQTLREMNPTITCL